MKITTLQQFMELPIPMKLFKLTTMQLIDFLRTPPPVLYGQITINGVSKIGSFKPEWNQYTNTLQYRFYTEKGRKSTGGFTLKKAHSLYIANQLSVDPGMGKKSNYI